MNQTDEHRVHPATPYHREQARRRGRFPKSALLTTALVATASLAGLATVGRQLAEQLSELAHECFSNPTINAAEAPVPELYSRSISILCMLTVFAAMIIAAILFSHLLQSRFQISRERDETGGGNRMFQRIFQSRRLGVSVLNLVCLIVTAAGLVAYVVTSTNSLTVVMADRLPASLGGAVGWLATVCLSMALVYFLFAGVDYLLAWWSHERELRMTDEELREQARNLEADGAQLSRRQEMHREIVTATNHRREAD